MRDDDIVRPTCIIQKTKDEYVEISRNDLLTVQIESTV